MTLQNAERHIICAVLSANEARRVCALLDGRGVRYWVMGGWGIDALLGRESRPHGDLDLLVQVDDMPAVRQVLETHGFSRKAVGEESRWVEIDGTSYPTVFIAQNHDGLELDVQLVSRSPEGLVPLYDNSRPVRDDIDGRGSIAGYRVRCIPAATQIDMHRGYAISEVQRRDLELLEAEHLT